MRLSDVLNFVAAVCPMDDALGADGRAEACLAEVGDLFVWVLRAGMSHQRPHHLFTGRIRHIGAIAVESAVGN